MFNRMRASATPRKLLALATALTTALGPSVSPAFAASQQPPKNTPIQHIVVIFDENISFDHYFGTYPVALNPKGEPQFHALPGTPTVNGLTNALLNDNPNLNTANGTGATNPFRLDRSQAFTNDQDHDYTPEQISFDMGAMDLFPYSVGTAGPPPSGGGIVDTTGLTMGYFDGNTVTALWNYAQYFAMNDNSFSSTFGPSTPGVINLVSGQTNGAVKTLNGTGDEVDGGDGSLTVIGDPDPLNDVCSGSTNNQVQLGSKNIGDLLTAAGVSWGGFMGGFNLNVKNPNGTTGCNRSTTSKITAVEENDYIPHHAFFQYWASTANPKHTRPKSISEIGNAGPANHQYDLNDFFDAVSHGNFPAVSFLKAQGYQDAHAGYSDPLDEQNFVVKVLNFLQGQDSWDSTAVVILYDDSDGWYDHQMSPIVNQSTGPADALTGPDACGTATNSLPGIASGNPHALGRCGYGPRQPLLVISPWARQNYVDHTVTDQTSVIRFIEDNWLGGKRLPAGSFDGIASSISQLFDFTRQRQDHGRLLLDPNTGEPVR
jgi:phospholipase C